MTRMTVIFAALAVLVAACGKYETGRGDSPQSIHPGDIVRQQAGTDTSDQEE